MHINPTFHPFFLQIHFPPLLCGARKKVPRGGILKCYSYTNRLLFMRDDIFWRKHPPSIILATYFQNYFVADLLFSCPHHPNIHFVKFSCNYLDCIVPLFVGIYVLCYFWARMTVFAGRLYPSLNLLMFLHMLF